MGELGERGIKRRDVISALDPQLPFLHGREGCNARAKRPTASARARRPWRKHAPSKRPRRSPSNGAHLPWQPLAYRQTPLTRRGARAGRQTLLPGSASNLNRSIVKRLDRTRRTASGDHRAFQRNGFTGAPQRAERMVTWNRTSSGVPVLERLRAFAPARSTAASRDRREDLIPSSCSRHRSGAGEDEEETASVALLYRRLHEACTERWGTRDF